MLYSDKWHIYALLYIVVLQFMNDLLYCQIASEGPQNVF
jgi:hypothetical protein